ncbi:MAG: GMC family oxidoreductase, partial [Pseudomonadota bacterium]
DACEEIGIPKVDDFNTGNNFGSSYFQVNQRSGFRWNASKAFLRPTKGRPNLRIVTEAHVTKLELDGGQAAALELNIAGQSAYVRVGGELILSSGAVGTPQILQLSGIGPGALCQSLGIEVQHESPNVGMNLQDHLQLRCIYKVQGAETLNKTANTLWGKAKIGLQYAWNRKGPMAMAPSQVGVFAKSSEAFETPNLQYHVQPLSLEKFGDPLHDFPAMTASVCNLRPESRGEIVITSPDPMAHPAIRPNYLSTPGDRAVAADSIRLTRKIMKAPSMQQYSPEEYLPGDSIDDQEALENSAGDIGTTIFHPVSTCRMGEDDGAVVDSRLRFRGIDRLRVIDASVMPAIVSGNTSSPTVMIAEKGAEMILEDARRA